MRKPDIKIMPMAQANKATLIIMPMAQANKATLIIHERQKPDQVGQYALDLISRGIFAGVQDKETRTGEPLLRLLSPEELVIRSCEISAMVFQELARRDWLLDLPSYEDITESDKDKVGF